jgi:hypothetical protein
MRQLTYLEEQVIKTSLGTKTNEEIAELLELPVDELIEIINSMTDGKAEERQADVIRYQQEKLAERPKRAELRKEKTEKQKQAELQRAKEKKQHDTREQIKQQIKQRRAEHMARPSQRSYATRAIDYSKTVSVKLDEKTYAMVEIQDTPEKTQALIAKTKATYEANKQLNKLKHSEV